MYFVYLLYKYPSCELPFYVGVTCDIKRRIKEHSRQKEFSHFKFIKESDVDTAYQIESAFIAFFKPDDNGNSGFLFDNKTYSSHKVSAFDLPDQWDRTTQEYKKTESLYDFIYADSDVLPIHLAGQRQKHPIYYNGLTFNCPHAFIKYLDNEK